MSKTKRIIITILCLIGLGLTLELCKVFYNANFAINSTPSICAINDAFDCDSVAKTSYSQFLGIPLALWGLIFYLFVLIMTYVHKISEIKLFGFMKVFKNPSSYIYCVALLSFILSMILGCISIFKINSICIFCFMTYFIDLLIAITAKNRGCGMLYELKNSINDFIEAIKVKRYAISFVIVMLCAAGLLTYTSLSNVLAPQMIKKKMILNNFGKYQNYSDGNELGPKDADLVITEYMDFNCGGCFYANIYLHRIVSEFENVKVIQYNLPLDSVCNHNVKEGGGHKNSCLKSRYALAAKRQNKYWNMSDALFSQGPETEKEIIDEARLLDFDIKKLKEDANSEEVKQEISDMIKDADSKNITGTPTLFIGMKMQLGIPSYPEFKKMIIDNGGREKKQ